MRNDLIQINKIQITPQHYRLLRHIIRIRDFAELQMKAAIRTLPNDYYCLKPGGKVNNVIYLNKITFLDLSGCGLKYFRLRPFSELICLILKDNKTLRDIKYSDGYNSYNPRSRSKLNYVDLTNCVNSNAIANDLYNIIPGIQVITGQTQITNIPENNSTNHIETVNNPEIFALQNNQNRYTKGSELHECFDSSNLEELNYLQENLFEEMLSRISFVVFTNIDREVTAINPIIEEGEFISEEEFANKTTVYNESLQVKPSCEFIVCKRDDKNYQIIKDYLEKKCGMVIADESSQFEFIGADFKTMARINYAGYRYAPFNYNLQLFVMKKLSLSNLGLGNDELKMISDCCPFLEYLDMNGNQITRLDFNGTVLDNLTHLDLGNNHFFEDGTDYLENQLKLLKSLKYLVIEASFTKDYTEFFRKFREIEVLNTMNNPFPLSPPERLAVKMLNFESNNMDAIEVNNKLSISKNNTFLTIMNDNFTYKDDLFEDSKFRRYKVRNNGSNFEQVEADEEDRYRNPQGNKSDNSSFEVTKLTAFLDYFLVFFEKAQYIRYFTASNDWSSYPKYIQGITFTLFTYVNQFFLFFRNARLVLPFDNFIEFFWYGLLPIFMMWFMQKHISHSKLIKYYSMFWHLTISVSILVILLISEFTYNLVVKGTKFRYEYIWWVLIDIAISICSFFLSKKVTRPMESKEIREWSNIKQQICLSFIVLMQFPSMEFMFKNMKCNHGYYSSFPSVDCSWKLMPSYAILFLLFNCFAYFWFFINTIQHIHKNAHKTLELSDKESYWRSIWNYSKDEVWRTIFLRIGSDDSSRFKKLNENFGKYNDFMHYHLNPAKILSEGRTFASSWFVILDFTYRLLVSIDDFFELKSIFTLLATMAILVIYIFIPSKFNFYERATDLIFTIGTLFMSLSTIFGNFKHHSASSITLIIAVVGWTISYTFMLIGLIISFLPTRLEKANSWAMKRWYTGERIE
ncbi:Leucine Rich Repeat family protein [Trichomonas vaginalis G3]|uniref:Leucine Rich Repeat family protein n=1 Tax=Trichomonas vaginalis (strain ATCC PRA-98 / G3) TaxID=412133 RepID=A2DC93_TRIV3|nr:uncharacterized protein TVAGG3_0957990 [Trichomonas vaginalis G3]EAY21830.1 Leucine Rich Repeat family protein [Trichomonas vaginalis G3]KAI5487700.1 RNI-like family [Trichomonas vaginalis G3]|eukprot:XP_001582816.1 hypothetical protein [Trichomonas vaginalis G3]